MFLRRLELEYGVGLVGSPLLGHGSSQSGDGLVVSILFSSSLQGFFDTCALSELVLILIHGLAGVHAAGSTHGVAAHHGLALHDDNALALAGSSQGSGHACAACAHDNDVGINGRVLSRLNVVLHSGLEILRLQTSSGDGSSGCLLDGIGGNGCGRHAVHGNAAALGNGSGQLLDCLGANALGLIGTLSGAAGDLAVGQGQGNGNIAAKASMYSRVAAANASWHSVFTLIFATPRLIAFLIMSVGMPVPPCSTRGRSPVRA